MIFTRNAMMPNRNSKNDNEPKSGPSTSVIPIGAPGPSTDSKLIKTVDYIELMNEFINLEINLETYQRYLVLDIHYTESDGVRTPVLVERRDQATEMRAKLKGDGPQKFLDFAKSQGAL
jgi:hypothetical protein